MNKQLKYLAKSSIPGYFGLIPSQKPLRKLKKSYKKNILVHSAAAMHMNLIFKDVYGWSKYKDQKEAKLVHIITIIFQSVDVKKDIWIGI